MVLSSHAYLARSSGVVNAIYGFTAFDQQVCSALETLNLHHLGGDCHWEQMRCYIATNHSCIRSIGKSRLGTRQELSGSRDTGKLQQALAMFNAEKTMSAPDFFYMIADGAAMAGWTCNPTSIEP